MYSQLLRHFFFKLLDEYGEFWNQVWSELIYEQSIL